MRAWIVVALGAGLIVHGALEGPNVAEIGFGFSLLGVEPLARARGEDPVA